MKINLLFVIPALLLAIAAYSSPNVLAETKSPPDSEKTKKFFEHIERGDTEVVESMIAEGADPNAQKPSDPSGTTTLQAAMVNVETMQVLIKAGAKVNAVNSLGSTALMWAAHHGRLDAVVALVKGGADVNQKSPAGMTALMSAVGKGHQEIASYLLEDGADVNAKTADGMTPLMAATFNGDLGMVQLLLASRADVNAKSKAGKTARTIAREEGQREIEQVLKDAGGKK